MWTGDWVETAELIRRGQHDSTVKGEAHWRYDGDSVLIAVDLVVKDDNSLGHKN
jgi:hypothetical protein